MASATVPASPERNPSRLPWPFQAAFLPLWWAWLAASWWAETARQLAELPPGMLDGPARAVPLVLGGRAFQWLAEAALYAAWWRSRGTPLPYWRFLTWIASLSAADLLAFAVRHAAPGAPPIGRVAAIALAGPGALEHEVTTGAAAAFGAVGALALVRVAMTAWAAARGTGRSVVSTLLVIGGAWFVTRLVLLWSYDLLRGVSPVR